MQSFNPLFYNSEPECPTLISVNGTIVQKISKEPVWLQHCDHIRFISSKDNVSRFFGMFVFFSIYSFVTDSV